MSEIWICNDCGFRTKDEKKAMKHSLKIKTATYHSLTLNEKVKHR